MYLTGPLPFCQSTSIGPGLQVFISCVKFKLFGESVLVVTETLTSLKSDMSV